ncbi:MAG: DUF86 domain-containing protein [Paludibacteraceae bacterium]|nr:DUF86 domain-containing protein [Paludibacteraceae bacterium]
MESMSSSVREVVVGMLSQIDAAINEIQVWNKDVRNVDDYLSSLDGSRNLAATSMMLESIGEAVKKIDKLTNGELFLLKHEIPWKQIKGMRDHIAHGYFDIDVEMIWQVVNEELLPLQAAIKELITCLNQCE